MSANINSYYENASLSMASYAMLKNGLLHDEYVKEIIKKGMSDSQAIQFASRYTVIDQYSNSRDYGFSGSGFSATLFWDWENARYTFAMRGTEPSKWNDVALADFSDIGGKGIAARQGVDLFNYYQRLITPAGGQEKALQLELKIESLATPPKGVNYSILEPGGIFSDPTYMYLQTGTSADGLGLLSSGEQLNITGHSLGGQLAMMMGRMFNGSVNEVYTYNAPGFDTNIMGSNETEWFFDAIAEAQIRETGGTTVDRVDFPAAKFTNCVTPYDLISKTGTVPGVQIPYYGKTSNIPGVGEAVISTVANTFACAMPMHGRL